MSATIFTHLKLVDLWDLTDNVTRHNMATPPLCCTSTMYSVDADDMMCGVAFESR